MKKRRMAKTKPPNAGEVLAREEWDFSKVPNPEIETCFYYEYARARDDIRNLVWRWREKFADLDATYDAANTLEARIFRCGRWDEIFATKRSATEAFWRELAVMTDSTCAQLLINLPEFPETPWQNLDPSHPASLKTFLKFYAELDGMRGGIREVPWDAVLGAIRGYDFGNFVSRGDGELVAFRIDWSRGGVEKVINAFSKWARQRNATLKMGSKKKKPRESRYEHLKQLGAWRLKEKLGSWQAVREHTDKVFGCRLYGADDALWRKARLAAIKRTKEMFPILRAH